MKRLGKLKLNQLGNAELNERELSRLLGGGTPGDCCCGCLYATQGGSSTSANSSANNQSGLHSPGCSSGSGWVIEVNITVWGCDAPAGCNSTNGCNNNLSCP